VTAPFRLSALGAALLAVALANAASAAPQPASEASGSAIAGFDHIRTDHLDFNLNSGDFTIPGHFVATREGTDITADSATGNSKRKLLHAVGHVIVHQNAPLPQRGRATDLTQRPSTLTCDRLDADGVRKLFTADGNMHFTQEGGREATADHAVLDDANHHLHMEGHVVVKNGDQTIASDVLDYDTQTGQVEGSGDVTITTPVETPTPGPAVAPKKKK
jgi:lipopolysaccharide assembly outer membrane protein LptD (OstA)